MQRNQETTEIKTIKHSTRYLRGQELFEAKAARKVRTVRESVSNQLWTLWKVKSSSKTDYMYEVIDKGNEFYECNCPDFTMRNEICKHVYAVILTEVAGTL